MPICPNCNIEVAGNFCPKCGVNFARTPTQAGQPRHKPLPRKATIAIVLAIVSIVMLFIVGASTWWSWSLDGSDQGTPIEDHEYKEDYTLGEMEVEREVTSDNSTTDTEWKEGLGGDMRRVSSTTSLFLLMAIVSLVLTIVLMGLVMFGARSRPFGGYTKILHKFALIFTLLAVVFILSR